MKINNDGIPLYVSFCIIILYRYVIDLLFCPLIPSSRNFWNIEDIRNKSSDLTRWINNI